MARPAVNFNSTLRASCHVFDYDSSGKLVGTSVLSNKALGWRKLNKSASVTTKPGYNGVYHDPTNYFCEWGRATCTPGETYVRHLPTGSYTIIPDALVGSLSQNVSSLYSVPSYIWNELEIKALNKLRNQDVNFGVALAEAGETAKLFQTNVRRIGTGFTHLPDGVRSDARKYAGRFPKKVPSLYLEYMYGAAPLMSDVSGSCSLLEQTLRTEGSLFKVRTKKQHAKTVRIGFPLDLTFEAASYAPFKSQNQVVLYYRLRNFLLASLSTLGLVNPLEIVWERVPYSFVADWFVPIGSWLSALSGDFGYDFERGFRSSFCTMELNRIDEVVPSSPTLKTSSTVRVDMHAGSFTRTKYASSPWPGLYLKSPVSAHHIAEALSLLATSMRR